MTDLPPPLTSADCDLRALDGFMLNVERLLASELWALSTGKQLKAALGLWCRAWKQVPAASLPSDRRIISGFAGISTSELSRDWSIIMRGFIECSDGRLYHRALAEDANRAWPLHQRHLEKRAIDAARLKRWRDGQRNAPIGGDETRDETRFDGVSSPDETRSVVPRQGQGLLKKESVILTIPQPDLIQNSFDGQFWPLYPRKVRKDAARKEFARALKRGTLDDILAGLRRYSFSADPRYQPHASRWLSAGNWKIEADTPPPNSASNAPRATDGTIFNDDGNNNR